MSVMCLMCHKSVCNTQAIVMYLIPHWVHWRYQRQSNGEKCCKDNADLWSRSWGLCWIWQETNLKNIKDLRWDLQDFSRSIMSCTFLLASLSVIVYVSQHAGTAQSNPSIVQKVQQDYAGQQLLHQIKDVNAVTMQCSSAWCIVHLNA